MAVEGLGERFDEAVLAGGGVLHLVDEEMAETAAGGQREARVAVEEGGAGVERELGEVACAARREDQLQLDEGVAQHVEERAADGPLLVGVDRRGEIKHGGERGLQAVALDGGNQIFEIGGRGLGNLEADVIASEAGAPAAVAGLEQKSDDRAPVVEVIGYGLRGQVFAGADGERGCGVLVAGQVGVLRGEGGEVGEQAGGHRIGGVLQASTDDGFERAFEARSHDGVEVRVVQRAVERDELAPLFAGFEHAGEQALAVGKAAVAVQQHGGQRVR
jgi:hypothetical protein